MEVSDGRPFPPGDYPLVIVGTGPGGLQTSYDLRRWGIEHAVISRDEGPGGMFRRFPRFQRLITPSRQYSPVERGCAAYYRYDWNSLVPDKVEHQSLVTDYMDSTNYFPARSEIETAFSTFVERAGITARYGCEWRSTRQEDDGRFVLETSDGEYRAPLLVFATGMLERWTPPDTPGIDEVPHYLDLEHRDPETFRGKRVFVVGKRNSAFEIADGLLPWCQELVLGSPHPVRPSIQTAFPTAPRARYVQPLEDHLFGGGTFVVDVTIDAIERNGGGWSVRAQGTTHPGARTFEVDEVIACTGFGVELRDLPKLGVATFYKDRLPTQSPYWESTSTPGIYFAGATTQGQAGMRKFGRPSGSASIGGFRYNAKVQARHIAQKHFGIAPPRPTVDRERVVSLLLREATTGGAVWRQMANLGRQVTWDPDGTLRDDGYVPVIEYVDSTGPDALTMTVELNSEGTIQPCAYVRRGGNVTEHPLDPGTMHEFRTDKNRAALDLLVAALRH
jgi:thioredoxin reductase